MTSRGKISQRRDGLGRFIDVIKNLKYIKKTMKVIS
jgi:hypothetical protein